MLDLKTFEFDMTIEMVQTHKSPCTDKSTLELIIAGSRTIRCEIQQLNSIWNKEESLRNGRSRSLYQFIRRVIKQIIVIIEGYYFCQLGTKFYPNFAVKFISLCKGIC